MSRQQFVFDGMAEFRAMLRNLPADLTAEASTLVTATANTAAIEIRSGYASHTRSGRLAGGVVVTHVNRGKFSAGAIVKSTAPHAAIFENGTQARHTALGANRGSMPPGNVFIPVIVRRRRTLVEALKAMVARSGLFRVSGS